MIFQEDEEAVALDETAQQIPSNRVPGLCQLGQKMRSLGSFVWECVQRQWAARIRPSETSREIEMADLTTPESPQSEISFAT